MKGNWMEIEGCLYNLDKYCYISRTLINGNYYICLYHEKERVKILMRKEDMNKVYEDIKKKCEEEIVKKKRRGRR